MVTSSATSAALIAILTSVSLSLTPNSLTQPEIKQYTFPSSAVYQTASSENIIESMTITHGNKMAAKNNTPKDEALLLFGEQSNFTESELETYRDVLSKHSKPIGINVYDLI
jgi:hypothetical protein